MSNLIIDSLFLFNYRFYYDGFEIQEKYIIEYMYVNISIN